MVLAISGKIAGGFLLVREYGPMRTSIGMAMVPPGEVGLVFAELGREAGVLDGETYAALVLVIAYTTLLSPFCTAVLPALRRAPWSWRWSSRSFQSEAGENLNGNRAGGLIPVSAVIFRVRCHTRIGARIPHI
ncbi:MAG: cation:proton antiporter [Halioglobus sp.]